MDAKLTITSKFDGVHTHLLVLMYLAFPTVTRLLCDLRAIEGRNYIIIPLASTSGIAEAVEAVEAGTTIVSTFGSQSCFLFIYGGPAEAQVFLMSQVLQQGVPDGGLEEP